MRNLLLCATTVFVCCATPLLTQTCTAQSTSEPAVIISMAPLGEQLDDMKHLVDASGYGSLNFMIQSQVKYYTGGIDREKPSGAYFYFEGDDPNPKWLAMVAVADADEVLDQISNFADVDEGDEFIIITPDLGADILIKEAEGYFLISDDKTMFDIAPEAPAQELMAAAGDQNLTVRIFGQRVPEGLRDIVVQKISEGFTQQMEELEQMDKAVIEAQLQQLESFISETDELMVGYKIDEESKLLTGKFSLTALEGSEMAKRVEISPLPGESAFTGFLNDAAGLDFNLRYKLYPGDVKMYVSLLDSVREQMIDEIDADGEFSDDELATIKSAASDIADSIKATLKEATLKGGVVDSGGVLMVDGKSTNFVGGNTMVETAKFEESVKRLVTMLETKSDGGFKVQFDAHTSGDVRLHKFGFTIPRDEEEARNVFGSEVEMVVGVSPDKIYFGAGKSPMEILTDAIERSKQPKPSKYGQLIYNVRVAPLLRFVSEASGEDALAEMAATLEKNNTGRMTVWSKPIDNGIETNLEVQDGILGLIKEGVNAYQEGAFQGGDDIDEF